ncbi:MAG: histidinol-phosphatase [Mesorhizobium sp.]|nr:histidinol-phosphatase [Mesorhizobium sp.]MBL8580359.1 histidinol-phosphatase [Mesorhizobium sp.]
MAVTVEFFRRIAAAAAAETLPRFRQSGDVANKIESGFDPVTEADREAEKAIRALIRAEYPDHGILGEEFGAENASNEHVWIIDPIDGTRSFISGIPLWGTLVGLTKGGDAIAGMMAQPFTGELFYAIDGKAWWEGPHRGKADRQRLTTRKTTSLADATLCTTTPALFQGDRKVAYERVEKAVRLPRYGTDCYAYAMLAAGNIDLVVEVGLQSYDVAALIPIVEAAGGVMTEWNGGPAEEGGGIVAAATPELHAAAMEMLHAGRTDPSG